MTVATSGDADNNDHQYGEIRFAFAIDSVWVITTATALDYETFAPAAIPYRTEPTHTTKLLQLL